MDIFSQNKKLISITVVLVALNVLIVGFFVSREFFPKKKREPDVFANEKKDVSSALKYELGLAENQVEQIKKFRADFFEKEKELSAVIRSQRDSMNLVMFNKTTDENLVKQFAQKVADNEFQMELLRIEQAKAFKRICTPDQLEKFEGLVREIKDYFKPNKNRKNDELLSN